MVEVLKNHGKTKNKSTKSNSRRKNTMQLIQGTTPTIEITVRTEINLQDVQQIWLYIYQHGQIRVDKIISDVTFDIEHRIIRLRLTQNDTLSLKEGECLFQIRLLLDDGTALGTIADTVEVFKAYKDGVII